MKLFRRHGRNCRHWKRKNKNCACPFWVDGYLPGNPKRKRHSLNVSDESTARAKLFQIELQSGTGDNWTHLIAIPKETEPDASLYRAAPRPEPITLKVIWEKFLADLRRRNLVSSTIKKYERLGEQMLIFADHLSLKLLAQIDLDTLSTFYGQWTEGPLTRQKKLERLRAFYHYAAKRKWVTENLASDLNPPKINRKPTLPFSRDEMQRILRALNQYAESAGRANAERLRAFVLVLRYSGLRIGDAVQLSADKLHGNKIFLRTAKTGQPVFCPLPDPAITALGAIPKTNEMYFFWTGRSTLHSAISKWQKRLKRLFEMACVTGGHAHRFRHTFAVELLLSGVLMERVSVMLGHSNTKITERYYAAWTRARQEQAEADVEGSWRLDPVLNGTHMAREKQGPVN